MAWLGLLSFATLLAAVAYYAPRNCSIKSFDAAHAVQCTLPGIEGIQGAQAAAHLLPRAQTPPDICQCPRYPVLRCSGFYWSLCRQPG
jgi:hypothetical protein